MNNTPKHTPGPWEVEPRQWDQGASLAIVAPANGWIVAIIPFDGDIQTEDEPDYNTVKRHPDEVPNAHIIAAAPAMYEALQWAKQYVRMPNFHPDNSYGAEEWAADYNKLQTALAQAEGRG